MILHIFAIHDRQGEAFMNPMMFLAPGQAMRFFTDEVNRSAQDNLIYTHSDDFDLFQFGTFDTTSGEFALLPRPVQIALGKNLKLNGSSS